MINVSEWIYNVMGLDDQKTQQENQVITKQKYIW